MKDLSFLNCVVVPALTSEVTSLRRQACRGSHCLAALGALGGHIIVLSQTLEQPKINEFDLDIHTDKELFWLNVSVCNACVSEVPNGSHWLSSNVQVNAKAGFGLHFTCP